MIVFIILLTVIGGTFLIIHTTRQENSEADDLRYRVEKTEFVTNDSTFSHTKGHSVQVTSFISVGSATTHHYGEHTFIVTFKDGRKAVMTAKTGSKKDRVLLDKLAGGQP